MVEFICAGGVFILLVGLYFIRKSAQRSVPIRVIALSAKKVGTSTYDADVIEVVYQVLDGPMTGEKITGGGSHDQVGHTYDGLFDPQTKRMGTRQALRHNYKNLTLGLIFIIALYVGLKLIEVYGL